MKALKMKNPPHPGFSVRVDCLEPHGLSVTEGAKILGVLRSALSHLVNQSADLSWEMAIRLAKAFWQYAGRMDAAAVSIRCGSGGRTFQKNQGQDVCCGGPCVKNGGRASGELSCSRNAHDQNVLVRRAQSRVRQTPFLIFVIQRLGEGEEEEEMAAVMLLCSAHPSPQKVIGACAQ